MKTLLHSSALLAFCFALSSTSVSAAEVGKIKVSTGAVYIERAAQRLPAPVGAEVLASDTIITGENGSAGITFIDNSRLSIGPNSVLAIDRLNFDQTTHDGAFDTSLKRGTLSVISGKIAKRSPDAMTVRTPSMILGVRGTEFVVRAGE
jgi:hypothetical protein